MGGAVTEKGQDNRAAAAAADSARRGTAANTALNGSASANGGGAAVANDGGSASANDGGAAAANDEWGLLISDIRACQKCALCAARRNAVVGRGGQDADVMIIGEGPGEQEDAQGLPFVGRSGALLDLALEGLSFAPGSFYIANIVKCRPPGNRAPSEAEAETCMPYLRRQTRLIAPKMFLLLGATASRYILGKEFKAITSVRGQWVERKGLLFMPTFHPAALLRDDRKKGDFWHDIKQVRERIK